MVRSVLTEFLPLIPLEIPLIFVSKGLEAETGLTAPEIAAEFVEIRRIVFMGGPMSRRDNRAKGDTLFLAAMQKQFHL